MKNIKTFEGWKNNIIDNSLFTSGKAKYDPHVTGGAIRYKTGSLEPYYFARIEKRGNKFICKIYRKDEDGEVTRLRNKLKKNDLKTAHNYVREFLNQKLKRDADSSEENTDIKSKINYDDPEFNINTEDEYIPPYIPPIEQFEPPKRKTIIRRF